MAFENLSDKLNAAFKKLRGKGRLTAGDIKEVMREVRLALLEADVSYKVVKDFTKTVTERASGAEVLEALSPAQMVVKIVNEELCSLMGGENQKLNISSKSPSVVMLVGLQGAGKTTNGAKLRHLPSCSYQTAGNRRCSAGYPGVSDGADRPGRDCQSGH